MTRFVFDTSPLSAFAQADAIDTLRRIIDRDECLAPKAVFEELGRGTKERGLCDAQWLTEVHVDDLEALRLFVDVKNRLGEGPRDIGEATVLAYAGTHHGCAVIDDLAARNAADAFKIEKTGTLGLLDQGLRNGLLSTEEAVEVIERMRGRGVRLPYSGSEFVSSLDL